MHFFAFALCTVVVVCLIWSNRQHYFPKYRVYGKIILDLLVCIDFLIMPKLLCSLSNYQNNENWLRVIYKVIFPLYERGSDFYLLHAKIVVSFYVHILLCLCQIFLTFQIYVPPGWSSLYQIWCCRPSFPAQKFQPHISGQKLHSMNKKRTKNTKLDRKLTTPWLYLQTLKCERTFFHNFEEILAISIIY